jgi:hypothetical protein
MNAESYKQTMTDIFNVIENNRHERGEYNKPIKNNMKVITAKERGVKPCKLKAGDFVKGTVYVYAGIVTQIEKIPGGFSRVYFTVTHEIYSGKVKKVPASKQWVTCIRHDEVELCSI